MTSPTVSLAPALQAWLDGSAPAGAGLSFRDDGRVVVALRFSPPPTAADVARLDALGVDAEPGDLLTTLPVDPALLRALLADPSVASIAPDGRTPLPIVPGSPRDRSKGEP